MTSSIAGKRNLLQSDRSAGLFIDVLYTYRAQGKYRLHEFVVMPDHFHALITINSGMSVEKAVQFIKGGFAYRAGKEWGFSAPVWERGFSELRVKDWGAFQKVGEYIRQNPVRRHLVLKAEEFRFSSAFPGFELDPAPQGLKPAQFEAAYGTAKAVP